MSEYWKMTGQAPIPRRERFRCRLHVLGWAVRNSPKLFRDVAYGVEHAALRLLDRLRGKRNRDESEAFVLSRSEKSAEGVGV